MKTILYALIISVISLVSTGGFANHLQPNCSSNNLVEVAQKAGSFKTLVTALKATGLNETLSGKGPFTVFAPTDQAFAKLPKGTVESLLQDKKALTNILLYHVVAGAAVPATTAVTLTSAEMANGKTVKVVYDGKNLFINDARVVTADVKASNGIIHVIDTVLLP